MSDEAVEPSTPETRPSYRVLRHQLLAKILELVLTPVDITVESELQVMSEPPKADLLLLRRHGKAWSEAQRKLLPDGVRDRQAHHHLLECKFTESVNEEALQQTLSYDFFYRRTQQLAPAELQTYVVSAKTPRGAMLAQFGYVQGERPGVYVTEQPLLRKVVLLVLNELSSEPQNEFLRLFASRQRVRKQTMAQVLQDPLAPGSEELFAAVFGLQRLYQMEDDPMKQELTVEDVIAIGDNVRRQVIASATVEERLTGLSPEERLSGMSPEEMAQLFAQLESLLTQQTPEQPKHRKSGAKL